MDWSELPVEPVVDFDGLKTRWMGQGELPAAMANMKPGEMAQLRLVPKGERKSLEDVLEETRQSSRWAEYFSDFRDPYLHLTPAEYAALAQKVGFTVRSVNVGSRAWDFHSASGFFAFGSVTFVEWTRKLPESKKPAFINDVLDCYRLVAGDEKTFKFYQMDIRLERS